MGRPTIEIEVGDARRSTAGDVRWAFDVDVVLTIDGERVEGVATLLPNEDDGELVRGETPADWLSPTLAKAIAQLDEIDTHNTLRTIEQRARREAIWTHTRELAESERVDWGRLRWEYPLRSQYSYHEPTDTVYAYVGPWLYRRCYSNRGGDPTYERTPAELAREWVGAAPRTGDWEPVAASDLPPIAEPYPSSVYDPPKRRRFRRETTQDLTGLPQHELCEGRWFLIRCVEGTREWRELSANPPLTNIGGQMLLRGWLGETNNVSRSAEGAIEIRRDDHGYLVVRDYDAEQLAREYNRVRTA